MTIEEIDILTFTARLAAQGVARIDLAFVCPLCRTVQSMRSLIATGKLANETEAERYIGFSCIGRFTNAGPPAKDKPPGGGCNWTLGGLLQLHEMVVIDEQGERRPYFAIADREAAQALAAVAEPVA